MNGESWESEGPIGAKMSVASRAIGSSTEPTAEEAPSAGGVISEEGFSVHLSTRGVVRKQLEMPRRRTDLILIEIETIRRAKQLTCPAVTVNLIAAVRTNQGLRSCCELGTGAFAEGRKVTDEQMKLINMRRDEPHGGWNYTVRPRKSGGG